MYNDERCHVEVLLDTCGSAKHVTEHLVDICEAPWFYRVWTIQEYVLSTPEPMVQVGQDTFRLSQLSELFTNIATEIFDGSRTSYDWFMFSRVGTRLDALRYLRTNQSARALYLCLSTSQSAMATDPRDKVFGLLGICDFACSEPVITDYSKTVQQVFTNATIVSIREHFSYPFFHYALHPPQGVAKVAGVPSWAIDFSLPSRLVALGAPPHSHLPDDHGTTYEDEIRQLPVSHVDRTCSTRSFRVSDDRKTLFTYGRFVGTVVASLHNISHSGNFEDDWKTRHSFYSTSVQPRNSSLIQMLHALSMDQSSTEELKSFQNEPAISARPPLSDVQQAQLKERSLFITQEGHVGVSYHYDPIGIQANDILVCLFGLRPVSGTRDHIILNVAYVPGNGDDKLHPNYFRAPDYRWVDFAAEEGSKEYAIV
jgi:hypothetical protein